MRLTTWSKLNSKEKAAMKAGCGWHEDILVIGKFLGIKNNQNGCDWKEVIDYDDKKNY